MYRVSHSVCPHVKTKKAKTTIAKLATKIVHDEFSPFIYIRSKDQGHKVTKCINILRAIKWSA